MRRALTVLVICLAGSPSVGHAAGEPEVVPTELTTHGRLLHSWVLNEQGIFGFESGGMWATLTTKDGAPVAGRIVTFRVGRDGPTCSDLTDAEGMAGCSPSGSIGDTGKGYTASFAGDEPTPDAAFLYGASEEEGFDIQVVGAEGDTMLGVGEGVVARGLVNCVVLRGDTLVDCWSD